MLGGGAPRRGAVLVVGCWRWCRAGRRHLIRPTEMQFRGDAWLKLIILHWRAATTRPVRKRPQPRLRAGAGLTPEGRRPGTTRDACLRVLTLVTHSSHQPPHRAPSRAFASPALRALQDPYFESQTKRGGVGSRRLHHQAC